MPKVIEVDILQQELDQKLPHWLSPQEKDKDKLRAKMDQKRANWLAEKKAKSH